MKNNGESTIFGVSARGWIAFMIVFTVCWMSALALEIPKTLDAGFMVCLGFFFGQKFAQMNNQ